jgi:diacylglycerol O-acyltransferase-1
VHSEIRPSTLSHDSPSSPSFLGFRNLMVIVLGVYLTASLHVPPANHPQSLETCGS